MATGRFDLANIQFRGRVGDLVFLPQPDGRFIVRRMPSKPPRRSALQKASSARVVTVGAAWQALTLEETEAWGRYSAREGRRAYNVFLGLGAKCLQMRPDAPVPRLPPTSGFLGDGIEVTVEASPSLACQREGMGGESPEEGEAALSTPHPPSLTGVRGGGAVRFSSSASNSPGVVTELLAQRLASKARKPSTKEYKSRGFVAFAAGSLSVEVPCEVGAWACAVRFVREATGQETAIVPLGKVVVG